MHEVLVTGMGGICAIGRSVTEIFASALTGRSGVCVEQSLAIDSTVPLVARAPFNTASVAMRSRGPPLDRVSALALEAARQAFADAGVAPSTSVDTRLGVYWGTGAGGVQSME